eukprot:TRINITY_DN5418_c0_g1_i1.p2 TRINITY_DN5418_c0_g1~~TRINITY_DN5418_c0_g1_i1.p2  ORF type:complete len:223 (+),score=46.64 TRINITY_DN5418_c0_g1_i1:276-944(+)
MSGEWGPSDELRTPVRRVAEPRELSAGACEVLERARSMQRSEVGSTVAREGLRKLRQSTGHGDDKTETMLKELELLEEERTALLKEETHQQLWNAELLQRIVSSPPPLKAAVVVQPSPSPVRPPTTTPTTQTHSPPPLSSTPKPSRSLREYMSPPPVAGVRTGGPDATSGNVVDSLAEYLFNLPTKYPITEEQVNAAFKQMLQLRVARDEELVRNLSPIRQA